MRYKNYIFDLYGTLVDIHTEEDNQELWEKMRLFYGYYGAVYRSCEEMWKTYGALVEKHREQGKAMRNDGHEACPEIQIQLVFADLFKEKGAQPSEELAVHAGQMFRALSTEYIRLYPGVPKLLDRLTRQGGNLYLLSNAQRIFTAYELAFLELEKYFKGILISSDYSVMKPDPEFFRLLLQKYDLKPEESIMIGNDEICDIKGAQKVGMDTCYIHSNISPEYTGKGKATYTLMKTDMEKLFQTIN